MIKRSVSVIFSLLITFILPSQSGWTQEANQIMKPAAESIEIRGLHFALVPEKNVFEQRRRYRYITDYLTPGLNGLTVHRVTGDISLFARIAASAALKTCEGKAWL